MGGTRGRGVLAALLAVALGLPGGPARAQDEGTDTNVQHFNPEGSGTGWYATRSPRTLDLWQPAFGLWLHYARDPYVFYLDDGEDQHIVGDLLTADVQAALGFRVADLTLDLPVHLLVGGDADVVGGAPYRATALGDVRLTPRVRFLDPERRGLGLGLAVPVTLPSGNRERDVGWRTVSATPTLLVAGHLGPVRLGGNVGWRVVALDDVYGLKFGPSLVFHVAVGVQVHSRVEIAGEIVGDARGKPDVDPVEWLVGPRIEPVDGLAIRLAGGTTIGGGLGSPAVRGVLGLTFTPRMRRDRDDDGVLDRDDACPEEAEDVDGVADADGCPEPARAVTIRAPEGAWVDVPHPYCARLQTVDGVLQLELPPEVTEIEVGAAGRQSVRVPLGDDAAELPEVTLPPVPDTGRLVLGVHGPDGPLARATLRIKGEDDRLVADGLAVLERPSGTLSLWIEAEGHEPRAEPVELRAGEATYLRVVLRSAIEAAYPERVYFAVGDATIPAASEADLRAVAARMRDHDTPATLLVVGMADPRGGASDNQALCRSRAEAVRERLIEYGAPGARLVIQIEPPSSAEAAAAEGNEAAYREMRRVEFRPDAASTGSGTDGAR